MSCYEQWQLCYLIQLLFLSLHLIWSLRSFEHFYCSLVLDTLFSLSFNDTTLFCFPVYLSSYFSSSAGSDFIWSFMLEVIKNSVQNSFFSLLIFILKIFKPTVKKKVQYYEHMIPLPRMTNCYNFAIFSWPFYVYTGIYFPVKFLKIN